MSLTRRLFIRWSTIGSTAFSAVLALARRATAAQARGTQGRGTPASAAAAGLGVEVLLPIAYVMLPAELGAPRTERATVAFARWIAGYREGEELLHPYGSDRIGRTGPSPAAKWADQVRALDAAAGALDPRGHPFRLTTPEIKKKVLDDALAAVQLTARVPSPLAAPHVAVALLAHFLQSPEATNLVYLREIDAKKCRPLATSANAPVALRRGGRA